MSVTDDQQFCLRWNNFQAYITSQFEALRDDEDFVDVTLACEGQRLGAHKVVLSACSPFFKELFKTNPCPHPIIFMRDVEVRHVIALLEFMYAGEVNVAQAQLAGFLRTAESLQIRGLTDASKNKKENDKLHTESQPTSTQFMQNDAALPPRSSPIRNIPVKSKQFSSQPKSQHSPSRAVTSTQERLNEELLSPPPCKKLCNKTDSESDGGTEKESDITEVDQSDEIKPYNSQINPFALQPNNKALHSEIDISADLIEPKLELPDYSEDDTNLDNSHGFLDANEVQNSFASLPAGMEIIPGTSNMADLTQDNQQAWDTRKLHSLDPRPCLVCGRVYSNLSNLRQHMRLIHNPTHVECPVCSKPFKTSLYLKRHLVSCRFNHAQNAEKQQQGRITTNANTDNDNNQTYSTTNSCNGTNNSNCYQQNDASTTVLDNKYEIKDEVANANDDVVIV